MEYAMPIILLGCCYVFYKRNSRKNNLFEMLDKELLKIVEHDELVVLDSFTTKLDGLSDELTLNEWKTLKSRMEVARVLLELREKLNELNHQPQ